MKSITQNWLTNLPITVQQTFKLVDEKEQWTSKPDDTLSSAFERLIASPNFTQIINDSHLAKNPSEAIVLITYLRIEQAICFIRMVPIELEQAILKSIIDTNRSSGEWIDEADEIEIGKQNLFSRLETLSRLNMLDRIFSVERRTLILNALQIQ